MFVEKILNSFLCTNLGFQGTADIDTQKNIDKLFEQRRKKWQNGSLFNKQRWLEAFRLYQHLASSPPQSIKDLQKYTANYDILTPLNRWDFPTSAKYSIIKDNISPVINYTAIILDSYIKGSMASSLFLKHVEELEKIDPEINIWENLEVTEKTFGIEELGDNVFHHLAKYAAIDSEFLKSKQGADTLSRLNQACEFLAKQGVKVESNEAGVLPSDLIRDPLCPIKVQLQCYEA